MYTEMGAVEYSSSWRGEQQQTWELKLPETAREDIHRKYFFSLKNFVKEPANRSVRFGSK